MNIFYLDNNPKTCASYHNDKHVVKMIVELAQLLSTAHRVLDGELYIDSSSGRKIKRWKLEEPYESKLYKATHINHPSAVWVRESTLHYKYTFDLWKFLCLVYTVRYRRHHKTESLYFSLKDYPKSLSDNGFIPPPQAMPDYCKGDDTVQAYRKYYIEEKQKLAQWKFNIPEWYEFKDSNLSKL